MVWVKGYVKFDGIIRFPCDFLILITLGHPNYWNYLHYMMNWQYVTLKNRYIDLNIKNKKLFV